MKTILQYKTIRLADPDILDDRVNELIAEGFQPYGNQISHLFSNNAGDFLWSEYSQVMVQYREED